MFGMTGLRNILLGLSVVALCLLVLPGGQSGLYAGQVVGPAKKQQKASKAAWAVCRKRYGKALTGVNVTDTGQIHCMRRTNAPQPRLDLKGPQGKRTYKNVLAWCKRTFSEAATYRMVKRKGEWVCIHYE